MKFNANDSQLRSPSARGGQAMMRLRRAFTIAALRVLASAATAYAECAWVALS
jgi:hypothetical protein